MAKAKTETEEKQSEMFPELGKSEEHQELLRLARKLNRADREHKDGQRILKEKRDSAEQKLVIAMHEAKLTCFRHDGVKCEIFDKEKCVVKVTKPDDDEKKESASE